MKKFVTSLFVILLSILFLYSSGICNDLHNNNSISPKLFPASKLKEDFKQFQAIIDYQHPKLFTDKDELDKLFKTQFKLIKGKMGELEFYRILAPIVAKLNCGHTGLNFSAEFESFLKNRERYLPLTVKIINDKLYVYQNPTDIEIPAGAEILDINGKPVKEIINILLNNITADGTNTSKKYYIMNHWFAEQYLSFIDTPPEFTITIAEPGSNTTSKKTFSAVNKEQLDALRKTMEPSALENNEPYTYSFENNYAILTIKSFGFYDYANRNKFQAFIDRFFNELAERKTPNLILDLRDNWGGDPNCSSYLFSNLIAKALPYFSTDTPYYENLKIPITPTKNNFNGNLFTLINGASFSSTGHLCSLLKYHHIGTFIGEETGGSYICTDNSRDIALSNTMIRLHYSTEAFKTAVSGLTPGRGIMPDYPITATIEDYLSNKDVAKALAFELITSKAD